MNGLGRNYIDEKGNYHNVQQFTLAQIFDSGVEEGYRRAKLEQSVSRTQVADLFYGMSDTMQMAVLDIMKVTQQKGESNE